MTHETENARTLYVRDCLDYRRATRGELLAAARGALSHQFRRGCSLESAQLIRDYLRFNLSPKEHEVFCVLFFDSRHRLITSAEMFRGTVDGATIHVREVVKEALRHNAVAVVLAHNHPSGVADPSEADESITRRLRQALALMDIRLMDHLIVAGESIFSFSEQGLL